MKIYHRVLYTNIIQTVIIIIENKNGLATTADALNIIPFQL